LIHRLPDSPECVETLLVTLAVLEEMPDRYFDKFVMTLIAAGSKLLLNLLSQVRW